MILASLFWTGSGQFEPGRARSVGPGRVSLTGRGRVMPRQVEPVELGIRYGCVGSGQKVGLNK